MMSPEHPARPTRPARPEWAPQIPTCEEPVKDVPFLTQEEYESALDTLGVSGLYELLARRYKIALQAPKPQIKRSPSNTVLVLFGLIGCIAITGSQFNHHETVVTRIITRSAPTPTPVTPRLWFIGDTEATVRSVQGPPSSVYADSGTITWVYCTHTFREFEKLNHDITHDAIDYVDFDPAGRVTDYSNRTGILRVK